MTGKEGLKLGKKVMFTYFDEHFSNNQWELYEEEKVGNTMNFEEARKALLEGKKVRCADWAKGLYVYFDDKNLLLKDNYNVPQLYGIYDKWSKETWELYEEPKKHVKVFISQPMHGRFKWDITEERDKIKKAIEAKYGEGYQIEYLNDDLWGRPKDWTRIQNLAFSITNMAVADIVVFAPDWNDAPSCLIEHEVAFYYDKRMYVCEADSHGEYRLY